jgi:hypothetical protein
MHTFSRTFSRPIAALSRPVAAAQPDSAPQMTADVASAAGGGGGGGGGAAAADAAHLTLEMSPEFAAEVTLHSSLIFTHTSLIALHRVISLRATLHIISFTRHRACIACRT